MESFREKASVNSQLRLQLPSREIENAYLAYETSWETQRLESEENRKIYCELIDLGQKPIPGKSNGGEGDSKPVSAVPSNDDREGQTVVSDDKAKWWTKNSVEARQPKQLIDIAVENYAKAYEGGPIDDRIQCKEALDFGLLANINLPIDDLIELDVRRI